MTPILWLFIPVVLTSKLFVVGAYTKVLFCIFLVFLVQFFGGVYFDGESVARALSHAFVIAIGSLAMTISYAYIRKEQSK